MWRRIPRRRLQLVNAAGQRQTVERQVGRGIDDPHIVVELGRGRGEDVGDVGRADGRVVVVLVAGDEDAAVAVDSEVIRDRQRAADRAARPIAAVEQDRAVLARVEDDGVVAGVAVGEGDRFAERKAGPSGTATLAPASFSSVSVVTVIRSHDKSSGSAQLLRGPPLLALIMVKVALTYCFSA